MDEYVWMREVWEVQAAGVQAGAEKGGTGVRERIRFTEAEFDTFTDMAAIAEANVWGEGDYQNWNTATRKKAFDSLCEKMNELHRRKEKA
jgi:hypothetical protein